MESGSIIIVVATDAPLDSRELRALLLRAGLGMGRTGLTSDVGSGDLFVGFLDHVKFSNGPAILK